METKDFVLGYGAGKNSAVSEKIVEEVDAWLDEHITNPDSPPLDRSLTSSSAAAPADMVGDINDEVGELRNTISGIDGSFTEKIDKINGINDIGLTPDNTERTNSGVTAQFRNERLAIYGTPTSGRWFLCLNGQYMHIGTSGSFRQTLPAGTYELHIRNESTSYRELNFVGYTYTNFSAFLTWNDGEIKTFEYPVMVGIPLTRNVNYGTSENPTLISIIIKTYKEKINKAFDFYNVEDNVEIYTDFKDGYINTAGESVTPNTPTPSTNWKHIIIPCKSGGRFIAEALGGGSERVLYCFCDSSNQIIAKSYTSSEVQVSTFLTHENLLTISAPSNTSYVVFNAKVSSDLAYNPKIYKLSDNDMINYISARSLGVLPYKAEKSWENYVVATYKNMIVINENGSLKISKDLGKTWSNGLNISGVGSICNYYLYASGCIGFFTDTKAYYSEDFENYYEASCYENDGATFTPMNSENFNSLCQHAERKFIDAQDIYVFSNYTINGDRKLIWYSVDNGHTYKIAYEFGTNDTYPARHIHDVIYYEKEDVYIVTTGDHNATDCRVLAFTYDVTNDSWRNEVLGGSARSYKWANIAIWADEIYYTFDNTPGKVMKCSYSDIGDVTKHVTILENMECDALSLCFSLTGELVVTQSTARSMGNNDVPIGTTRFEAARKLYYSSDRKSFNTIILPTTYINTNAQPYKFRPITNDGHCYAITAATDQMPSVRIDDVLHTKGYSSAFNIF